MVPCVFAIIGHNWPIAAACFTTAAITDFLDGPLARRRGEASPLGGLVDHTTDALFVTGCLAALAADGWLTPLLPMLVMAAFVQYVLDSRALAGRSLRTSRLGRYNGIGYFVLPGIPIISEAIRLGWPPPAWISGLGWLLVVTTTVSMFDRARAWWAANASSDPAA
jgi:phosphatidylglycerophosphate synthase